MQLAYCVRQEVDPDAQGPRDWGSLEDLNPRSDLVQAQGGGEPSDSRPDHDDVLEVPHAQTSSWTWICTVPRPRTGRDREEPVQTASEGRRSTA